jgi:TolA-binding protein
MKWETDFLDAEILLSKGKSDQAYLKADSLSKTAPDGKSFLEILIFKAKILSETGNLIDAVRILRQVYADSNDPAIQAKCLYLTGRIFDEKINDRDSAEEFFLKTVRAFPDTVSAKRAFEWMFENRLKTQGKNSAMKMLMEYYNQMSDTPIADFILYKAIAMYRDDDEEESDASALALIENLEKYYPFSYFLNDALMDGAEILKRNEKPMEAIFSLRKLLSSREKSFLIGSYDTGYYVRARFEIGKIFEEDLFQADHAVENYMKVVQDFPENSLCDDALYRIAVIYEKQGKKDASNRILKQLITDFPDTKFGKKAQEKIRNN